MSRVVPLRSREARNVAVRLAAAIAVAFVAVGLAVAIALIVPMPAAAYAVLSVPAIAAVALSAALVHEWVIVRSAARLVIDGDTVTVEYPDELRAQLVVPRSLVRVAICDEEHRLARFRIVAPSGEEDWFLWVAGRSPLPVLAPDGALPNVALIFEEPVAGARVRRSRPKGIHRGERLAGVLLAARDPAEAGWALAAFDEPRDLIRQDAFLIEEHLAGPADEGGRFALSDRRTLRFGWTLVAVGLVFPVAAAGGAVMGAILARWHRLHGSALAVVGLTVFAVRLALWLG